MIESLQDECRHNEQVIAELWHEVEARRQQLDERNQENDEDIKARYMKLAQQIRRRDEENEALRSEYSNLAMKSDEFRHLASRFEQAVEEKETEISRLLEALRQEQLTTTEVRQQLKSKNHTVEVLGAELKQHLEESNKNKPKEEEIARLRIELSDKEKMIISAKEESSRLSRVNRELRSRLYDQDERTVKGTPVRTASSRQDEQKINKDIDPNQSTISNSAKNPRRSSNREQARGQEVNYSKPSRIFSAEEGSMYIRPFDEAELRAQNQYAVQFEGTFRLKHESSASRNNSGRINDNVANDQSGIRRRVSSVDNPFHYGGKSSESQKIDNNRIYSEEQVMKRSENLSILDRFVRSECKKSTPVDKLAGLVVQREDISTPPRKDASLPPKTIKLATKTQEPNARKVESERDIISEGSISPAGISIREIQHVSSEHLGYQNQGEQGFGIFSKKVHMLEGLLKKKDQEVELLLFKVSDLEQELHRLKEALRSSRAENSGKSTGSRKSIDYLTFEPDVLARDRSIIVEPVTLAPIEIERPSRGSYLEGAINNIDRLRDEIEGLRFENQKLSQQVWERDRSLNRVKRLSKSAIDDFDYESTSRLYKKDRSESKHRDYEALYRSVKLKYTALLKTLKNGILQKLVSIELPLLKEEIGSLKSMFNQSMELLFSLSQLQGVEISKNFSKKAKQLKELNGKINELKEMFNSTIASKSRQLHDSVPSKHTDIRKAIPNLVQHNYGLNTKENDSNSRQNRTPTSTKPNVRYLNSSRQPSTIEKPAS